MDVFIIIIAKVITVMDYLPSTNDWQTQQPITALEDTLSLLHYNKRGRDMHQVLAEPGT